MSKRVLILGGGVVGLCTAYAAARRGHRVTVLDRGRGDDVGCSFGNAGMIVPSHFVPLAAPGMVALGLRLMWNDESPFFIRPRPEWELLRWMWRFFRASNAEHVARSAPLLRDLHLASRACFEDWSVAWGHDFGLKKSGLLMLCETEHGLAEEARTAEQARELGIPAEVLSAEETRAREPDLQMAVAGSVYFPRDCHLTPARFMESLECEVRHAGVTIVRNTKVTGFRTEDRRVVAALADEVVHEADEVVLACGVFTTRVARELGLSLPMQAGKGYSMTLGQPRRRPRVCAILSEARVAVTPLSGGALRFGGTFELTGDDAVGTTDSRVRGIVKSVTRCYPDFTVDDFRDVPIWSGLRPCSPDGLPYIGRFSRFDNLTAATGHAMMGMSLGPVTGELVAEILSNERPSIDIGALSPDRYA